MADLPIELWHSIFDHLQLDDLFSCALTDKVFYFAVKAYRIREIAFTRRLYEWFHYTTPISSNYRHRVDFTNACILKGSSFNFDYLKRLKIGRSSEIDLNTINRFVHLEELDIDLKNYKTKKNRTLSLANLKVLYVLISRELRSLKLNTPRLAKVCTFSLKKLVFIYPESVRCIHTFYHCGKLSMFHNLECLFFTDHYNQLNYLGNSHDYQTFEEFSLTNLEKLKEIDFHYNYSGYRARNMSIFKKMTINLLALGRPDLKVFWFHVQMTHTDLLTEYKRTMENVQGLVTFQLKFYEKLKDKVDFFYEFNTSMRLLSRFGFNLKSEEFLSKLLVKYSFRGIAVANRAIERKLLMELIARSPSLLSLQFSWSGLDQEFFDQMAETIRLNAIPLQLLRLKGNSNGIRNFDFMTKLQDLETFEIDQKLPNELVSKLLELPMLIKIQFFSDGFITKRIERTSRTRYRLNGESLSLQKLLEHFKPDSIPDNAATRALRFTAKTLEIFVCRIL